MSRFRQRVIANSFNIVGGGGSIPTFGNVVWGPQFGGDQGDIPEIGINPDLVSLALVNSKTCGCTADLDSLAIAANQSITVDVTGDALGAPFWQSVETQANSAASTTVVINKPTGTAEDDLLLAFIGQQGLATATFTPPAGWTSLEKQNVGATVKTAECFYKVAGASEPSSYTFTSTLNNGPFTGEIHRIIGIDTVTPIDVSASSTLAAAALDTDPDTPSVTTTVANTLVFSWIYHDHLALNQTHTPDAGHEETSDFESTVTGNINSSNSMWRVFSATGATGTAEHNCTESVSTDAIMMRVAIAPGPVTL